MYHRSKRTTFSSMWTVLFWLQIVLLSQDPTRLAVSASGDKWGTWASWEKCDRTCGGGSTIRMRQCQSPSGGRGRGCTGDEIEFGECGAESCSGGGGGGGGSSPKRSTEDGGYGGYGGYNSNPGGAAPPAGGGYNSDPAPPAGGQAGGYGGYNSAGGGYNSDPAPPAGGQAGGYGGYNSAGGGYNSDPAPPAGGQAGGYGGYNSDPGPPAGGGYDSNPAPAPAGGGYNSNPGPPAGGGYDSNPGPPAGQGGYGQQPQSPYGGGGAAMDSGHQDPMLIRDEVIDGNGFNIMDTQFDNPFAGSGAASIKAHVISIICIVTFLCLQNFIY